MGGAKAEVGRLGKSSLIYIVPSLLSQGLTFLLTPLYTRALTPADYGIIGLTNTAWPLLSTAMSLCLQSSITRLHFDFDTQEERNRLYSTIVIALAVFQGFVCLALHAVGALGGLDGVFRSIGYEPYLKWSIIAAYFGAFPSVLVNIFQASERPKKLAAFNLWSLVVTITAMLTFVVILRQGALGHVHAVAVYTGLNGTLAAFLVLRTTGIRFDRILFRAAISFGLPLMPHLMANYVLNVGDRWVLERFVSRADLGVYALAYSFGSIMSVMAAALSMAFTPALTRHLKSGDSAGTVPALGSYYFGALVTLGLGIAMLAPELIRLVTPPAYHSAGALVPWVTLGLLWRGSQSVLSLGTYYSKRTRLIAPVTAVAAALNVGLNLLSIPRFGVQAAAINTAIGYCCMTLLHGLVARRVFPIRWEFRKGLTMLGCAVGVFLLSNFLPLKDPLGAFAAKALIAIGGSLLALLVSRIATVRELIAIPQIILKRHP
ncbi:MAG: oligosaccharide flippase family protein [Polyangiaceae bacterium]